MILINNKFAWRAENYNELYPKMLLDFCTKKPITKKGKDKETGLVTTVASAYPTIQEFRVKHGITRRMWDYWAEKYPEM